MKPRHTAEQSTVKVNKAEKIGKRGFAAVASTRKDTDEVLEVKAPIESPIQVPLVEVAKVSTPTFSREEIREEIMEAATIQPSIPLAPKVEVKTQSIEFKPQETNNKLTKEQIMEKLSQNPSVQVKTKPLVCPVDPAELAQCEACQ
jgi:hypothetical protein